MCTGLGVRKKYPRVSIYITVTENLAERAVKERNSREHPADLMEEFLDISLQSLLGEKQRYEIETLDEGQEIDFSEDTAEESLSKWKDMSDTEHSSKLLITDQSYPESMGVAERTSDPFETCCAVLGEGYDLLELDETDWKHKVQVSRYSKNDFSRRPNYDPFVTVVGGSHEIGHNLGLEHQDGDLYEVNGGVALSSMASSYLDEHTDSEDLRLSDSIYWSPLFSDNAERKMEKLLY